MGKNVGLVYRGLNLCVGEVGISLSSVTHMLREDVLHTLNICKLVGSKGLTLGAGRASCGV